MYVCVCMFTKHSIGAGCDTRSFYKQNLIGLNSEFTGCHTKVKEISPPNYLPRARVK